MLLQFVPPNSNCYCQPPQNASLNLCMAHEASTIMNQQSWSFILQPKTNKKNQPFSSMLLLDRSEHSENCRRALSGYVSFSHTVLFLQILFVYLLSFYTYTLDSVLLFVLQWETAWGPRWRETSWQTSTTRLLSNCTMVSQPGAFHFASRASEKKTDFITVCLIALNSRNFPLSCFLIYCWIGFDWNSCVFVAFQTEGKLYLILDFLRGGDLFTRLSKEVRVLL